MVIVLLTMYLPLLLVASPISDHVASQASVSNNQTEDTFARRFSQNLGALQRGTMGAVLMSL